MDKVSNIYMFTNKTNNKKYIGQAENPKERYIIVYTFPEKEEKDIPIVFGDWLNRLKPHFPNGIKLKYFANR